MGGKPVTALGVLCFPEQVLPPEVLREILRGGQDKMSEAGVSIIGGHSVRDAELKFGYSVTGVVKRRELLTNAGVRRGDAIVLTKPLGTGILATALKQQKLAPAQIRKLTRSMTQLNRAAAEAAVEFDAHAATDVTGYGLIGHAQQMADASGLTLRLFPGRDWFLPKALEFATANVQPGGLSTNRAFYEAGVDAGDGIPEAVRDGLYDPQTSGGLLIAIPARRAEALRAVLRKRRIWSVLAGEATARGRFAIELRHGA